MNGEKRRVSDNDWNALGGAGGFWFVPFVCIAANAALVKRDSSSLPWLGAAVVFAGLVVLSKKRLRAGYLVFYFLTVVVGLIGLAIAGFGAE